MIIIMSIATIITFFAISILSSKSVNAAEKKSTDIYYRYMSFEEVEKFLKTGVVKYITDTCKKSATESAGLCFLAEKVMTVKEDGNEWNTDPFFAYEFLSGIVSENCLVKFKLTKKGKERIKKSQAYYAAPWSDINWATGSATENLIVTEFYFPNEYTAQDVIIEAIYIKDPYSCEELFCEKIDVTEEAIEKLKEDEAKKEMNNILMNLISDVEERMTIRFSFSRCRGKKTFIDFKRCVFCTSPQDIDGYGTDGKEDNWRTKLIFGERYFEDYSFYPVNYFGEGHCEFNDEEIIYHVERMALKVNDSKYDFKKFLTDKEIIDVDNEDYIF